MKLRLKKFRGTNTCFVALYPNGSVAFNAVGEVSKELPDEIALKILAGHTDMLEPYTEAPKPKKGKQEEEKVAEDYDNKMVTTYKLK